MTKEHQQTDVHESITKQDRNNINDPQKKHRIGTVSENILLQGFNWFNGAPTSPLSSDMDQDTLMFGLHETPLTYQCIIS